ncbi:MULTISPECIES: GTPase [Pseudothermotoga]|uniref:Ribosome biogenesis GTPase A n=3 Tax=Pseudothermotoga TaxID=1643951 RepID=A8F3W6_PSELT|nr:MULTISPECIES: GTPase [Pseudothermotoga]ABV32850.1 GTP-binding protein HSR1-related [Pseudothermotoga lettingae TMO]KUK21430.1 MAG: Ribosome biogenesis GTPase A [Pseudothermotoga lettingae]MDI3494087.1 ribosome biosis GTPase [Pseudothermotoga sp.]MDK2884897.1 ribosome biosis GTPase [Pseudothermotoga sp.]GLI48154.1 ribosome biogenesis GTPase A [Pseudothermotoga lettingae TMO]
MWYPGHMAKASKTIHRIIKDIDLVVELLDSRAPLATQAYDRKFLMGKKKVMILGKSDIADPKQTMKWKIFFESKNEKVLIFNKNTTKNYLIDFIANHADKNSLIMIVGAPNVGKSTLLNKLKGTRSAKVGAAPGITRGLQWFSAGGSLRILDTPGLLLPKLWSSDLAAKLLLTGCLIPENVPPKVLERAFEIYARRAKLEENSLQDFLERHAQKMGMILKGGIPDRERALVDFFIKLSQGKLGRFTFETVEEASAYQGNSLSSTET